MGFYAKWQEDRLSRLLKELAFPALIALLGAAITAFFLPDAGGWGIAGVAAALWIIAACIRYYRERLTAGAGRRPSRSETGMILAHLGVGVFLIGASLTNPVSSEKHLRMVPGDSFELAGYNFVFEGTRPIRGPNYMADEGEFIVYKNGDRVTSLFPQKRRYSSGQVMTEAALDPGLTRDLYVSLGESLDDRGFAWAIRIYHKPFIRFIWIGALLMMAGGFLAASDRRYRRKMPVGKTRAAGKSGMAEAPA
jgi:cytochrome c-type biogenesis protein CcmF